MRGEERNDQVKSQKSRLLPPFCKGLACQGIQSKGVPLRLRLERKESSEGGLKADSTESHLNEDGSIGRSQRRPAAADSVGWSCVQWRQEPTRSDEDLDAQPIDVDRVERSRRAGGESIGWSQHPTDRPPGPDPVNSASSGPGLRDRLGGRSPPSSQVQPAVERTDGWSD